MRSTPQFWAWYFLIMYPKTSLATMFITVFGAGCWAAKWWIERSTG